MDDIVPGMLEAIKKDFEKSMENNPAINRIAELLKNGTATYKDANNYATWTGQLHSGAIKKNIKVDMLPDGRMYYNIADRVIGSALGKNHELISDVAVKVQESMNKSAGIGIKAVKPKINQDRIDGLVEKLANEENFEKAKWLLDEPIVNFSQSIIDDTVKTNAELHAKSGLSPVIIRKSSGKCCDWCKEIVGTYTYPNVPDEIYRRHRYCRCTVEYDPGKGKRQNVWDKSWADVSAEEQAEALKKTAQSMEVPRMNRAEAKKFSMGSSVNDYFYKDQNYSDWKKSLTPEEFKSLQEYTSHNYKSINSYNRKNFNWSPDGTFGSVIDEAEEFMKNPPDLEPQRPDELFFDYKRRKNSVIPAEYTNAIASKNIAIESTEQLDGIIARYDLKDDLRTYRAIEPDALPKFNNIEDLIGQSYSDTSFMSTAPTVDSRAVNKDYIMEIYVPKGSGRGAYLEEFTAVNSEYEFLLPRNSKFKIFDVRKENGKNIVMMEMLP